MSNQSLLTQITHLTKKQMLRIEQNSYKVPLTKDPELWFYGGNAYCDDLEPFPDEEVVDENRQTHKKGTIRTGQSK